jgi:CHC2 zinc finger
MARIPDAELERLKSEVSVEQLVRAHGIELAKSGKDWRGRCPFHDDATPSLGKHPISTVADDVDTREAGLLANGIDACGGGQQRSNVPR